MSDKDAKKPIKDVPIYKSEHETAVSYEKVPEQDSDTAKHKKEMMQKYTTSTKMRKQVSKFEHVANKNMHKYKKYMAKVAKFESKLNHLKVRETTINTKISNFKAKITKLENGSSNKTSEQKGKIQAKTAKIDTKISKLNIAISNLNKKEAKITILMAQNKLKANKYLEISNNAKEKATQFLKGAKAMEE